MISGSRGGLRSFGILPSVDWYFLYRRFGKTRDPLFKEQTVPEELNLEDRTTGFPKT